MDRIHVIVHLVVVIEVDSWTMHCFVFRWDGADQTQGATLWRAILHVIDMTGKDMPMHIKNSYLTAS
jgi:hypothetical protein